jgi:hypothetical protein
VHASHDHEPNATLQRVIFGTLVGLVVDAAGGAIACSNVGDRDGCFYPAAFGGIGRSWRTGPRTGRIDVTLEKSSKGVASG